MKTSKIKMMLAVVLSLVMVFSLAACGGGSTESAETTEEPAASTDGKIKIGVSIWSSTDVLGSQCKLMIDAAAEALGVEVQYVDQGHVSEKVTASVEQLCAAGCQGIIICNSSDTEMASAIKTCNDNGVYLAQFFRIISEQKQLQIPHIISVLFTRTSLRTAKSWFRSFSTRATEISVSSAGSRAMLHGSEDGKDIRQA